MSSNIAIQIDNLSKCYHIYSQPRDRLKQFILPHINQLVGRKQRHYYHEFWALKNLSFEIRKGESVGLIGRNGSGKSTLLQMICGTLNPTSGTIKTNGRIAALLELGSGFNPEFTGRENVFMNAAVLGLSAQETTDRLDEILAFADIGEFIDQPIKIYSSGMTLRLAFAVQAMVDPEILIVDEALAVGDEKFQRKCFARIEDLKNRGTSILFVSHSGPQIIELCDRALLIESGEKILCAAPVDVVRSYQRLIYSPEAEQKKLLAILKAQHVGGESSKTLDNCHTDTLPAKAELQNSQQSLFDPTLTPETTNIYPEQGARIERIEIQDESGRAINVLQTQEKFQMVVSGCFVSNLDNVYFGIHIRSVSGAEITGQRYPEVGKYISTVKRGERFQIAYWFNQSLLPGTYFVGSGVWTGDGSTCAHRILDAVMFRVDYPGPKTSFGYCNMMAAPIDFQKG